MLGSNTSLVWIAQLYLIEPVNDRAIVDWVGTGSTVLRKHNNDRGTSGKLDIHGILTGKFVPRGSQRIQRKPAQTLGIEFTQHHHFSFGIDPREIQLLPGIALAEYPEMPFLDPLVAQYSDPVLNLEVDDSLVQRLVIAGTPDFTEQLLGFLASLDGIK